MALFDFSKQIAGPNSAKTNLSNTTAKFSQGLSDLKGGVGDVKGTIQGGVRGIKDVVKQGQAGFEDFKELIGLVDPTERFLEAKAKNQATPKVPLAPTADDYYFDSPQTGNSRTTTRSFQSHLNSKGVARTNRFRIEFTTPEIFKTAKWTANDKAGTTLELKPLGEIGSDVLGYSIESVGIPGMNFDSQIANYGGFKTQIVNGYTIDDITMTLRVSGNMEQKAFFDRWANSIYNFATGSYRFFDEYKTDLYIYQMDEANYDTYCIMLKGAYPKGAAAMDLNNADTSNYHRLTLQWCCEKIIPITVNYSEPPKSFGKANKDVKPAGETQVVAPLSTTDKFIKKARNFAGL